jgi:hypothetical protein
MEGPETLMNSFAFWLDRPFHPRRASLPRRRGAPCVIIRYRGSFARSAAKTLIVLLLLAIMSIVIGERTNQNLDANEVVGKTGSAAAPLRGTVDPVPLIR